jgi:simple sugar transport system permease protein
MDARLGSKLYMVALAALVVLLFVVLTMLAPSTYPTLRNITSMAGQMAPIGLLAICICLAFLIGGIDLSIVAVANASAIAAAMTMSALEQSAGTAGATLIGVFAGLAVGAVAGLINGILVSQLRVHPIPITLGTLALFTGISTGVTGGSTQYGIASLGFLGNGTIVGIPVSFLVFLLVVAALSFVTLRTRFGFRMYSVGASDKVSRFARIGVGQVQVRTYLLSGVIASIAGLVMFASTNAANVSFGSSYLILAILVAVLSGVDPYGGKGKIALVVLAVAVMQQVQTGINLALGRWSGANFAAEFGWGLLLILVLGLNQRLGRNTESRRGWRTWSKGGEDDPSATSPGVVEPERSTTAPQ